MAEVYWIHLKEHIDMSTCGYIGYTSKTAKERYLQHVNYSKSPSKKKDIIHKAILKYGDELIVETLIKGTPEYCLWLEEKLRPTNKIGWNIVKGGGVPPSALGRKATKEQILAQSNRMKLSGVKPALISTATKARMKKDKLEKGTWNFKKDSNLFSFWEKADLIYKVYSRYPNIDRNLLCSICKIDFSSRLHDIIRYIKKGFVPLENAQWKRDFVISSSENIDKLTDEDIFILTPHYKHPKASPIWKKAVIVYEYLLENKSSSKYELNRVFNLPHKSIFTLYDKLSLGWNPSNDKEYLLWLSTTEKEI